MTLKTMGNLSSLAVSLAFFSVLSIVSTAEAGGFNGGGGGAAVCRDRNNKIRRAYLIDTYERQVWDGDIRKSSAPELEQLKAAIARIPDEFQRTVVTDYAATVVRVATFLPPNVAIAPTTDLGLLTLIPEGCSIEPVGVYTSGGLSISREVYRALSKTDRAAFFLHEAIYKLARDTADAQDSQWTRFVVGKLFAKEKVDVSINSAFWDYIMFNKAAWNVDDWRIKNKMALAHSRSGTESFTVRVFPIGNGTRKFRATLKSDVYPDVFKSSAEISTAPHDLTLDLKKYRVAMNLELNVDFDDEQPTPMHVEFYDSAGAKTGQLDVDLQDLRLGEKHIRPLVLLIAFDGAVIPPLPVLK